LLEGSESMTLFDKRIVDVSKKIIVCLGERARLRDFIVKNL